MKRKIIEIDEDLCNGCGDCIVGCAEGALQLVNGKAKMVKEDFCHGFGDCIGECPTGALKVEQRESEEFDEAATAEHVRKEGGEDAVKRMMAAGAAHDAGAAPARQPPPGGCPGTRMRFAEKPDAAAGAPVSGVETGHVLQSDLQQLSSRALLKLCDDSRVGYLLAGHLHRHQQLEHNGATIVVDGCGGGSLVAPSDEVHYLQFEIVNGKVSFTKVPLARDNSAVAKLDYLAFVTMLRYRWWGLFIAVALLLRETVPLVLRRRNRDKGG